MLFFISCSSNCYLSEKEAFNYINPIIKKILDYKKNNNKYPIDLTEIKNLPYKIKKYPNKNAYYFINRKDLYMEVKNLSGMKLYLKIDFLKCNSSKSVHSISVDFIKNGNYNINYYKLPPALKQ